MVSKRAISAERILHAHTGFVGQKDEVERAANALVPDQGSHLAGAAVLGLRKRTCRANDSSAPLKKANPIPMEMMQTRLFDAEPAVTVSKAVKVLMVPRPPSAAPSASCSRQWETAEPKQCAGPCRTCHLLSLTQHSYKEHVACLLWPQPVTSEFLRSSSKYLV